ncbi:MAG TPA: hypothetical protein VFK12_08625 [Gammaproteobacteria bacterium]|nr:hypothetical protein [Gammaproteobacteria bacterium]
MRKRELDHAEAVGYFPEIRKLIKQPTAPIWWWRDSHSCDGSILHNGTLCAIDTGERQICVTAGHVYEQYLRHRSEFDDVECQIGNVRIRLENYLIDYSKELDLATFEISPILLAGSGILNHAPRIWPPECIETGEIVVLGGYPGRFREERIRQVEFAFASLFVPVAQSSSDHASFQLNLSRAYWSDGSEGIPAHSELGGMSGGPVFRYLRNPIEHFDLAGFIYQGSPDYELIFARHAACVTKSGNIVQY